MKIKVKPIQFKVPEKRAETIIECSTQMMGLLNCYVANNYNDALCRQHVKSLLECTKAPKVTIILLFLFIKSCCKINLHL